MRKPNLQCLVAYKSQLVLPSYHSLLSHWLHVDAMAAGGFASKSVNDINKWLQEEGFNESIRKIFEGIYLNCA